MAHFYSFLPVSQNLTESHISLYFFSGNILLNITLAESLPVQRMGKNNVTIVCVANPPMEPKAKDLTTPTMLLIRVKTSEDADELKEKLNQYKQ